MCWLHCATLENLFFVILFTSFCADALAVFRTKSMAWTFDALRWLVMRRGINSNYKRNRDEMTTTTCFTKSQKMGKSNEERKKKPRRFQSALSWNVQCNGENAFASRTCARRFLIRMDVIWMRSSGMAYASLNSNFSVPLRFQWQHFVTMNFSFSSHNFGWKRNRMWIYRLNVDKQSQPPAHSHTHTYM